MQIDKTKECFQVLVYDFMTFKCIVKMEIALKVFKCATSFLPTVTFVYVIVTILEIDLIKSTPFALCICTFYHNHECNKRSNEFKSTIIRYEPEVDIESFKICKQFDTKEYPKYFFLTKTSVCRYNVTKTKQKKKLNKNLRPSCGQ